MKAILTVSIIMLVQLIATAAVIGLFSGAGRAQNGALDRSESRITSHRPSPLCGMRSSPRPQFVEVRVRVEMCRPKSVLV